MIEPQYVLPRKCFFTKASVNRRGIVHTIAAIGQPAQLMCGVEDLETGKGHLVPFVLITFDNGEDELEPEAT